MAEEAREALEDMAAEQPWLAYLLNRDPLQTVSRVTETSVLILQGETDRQMTADQAEILGSAFRDAGNPDVTVRVFPDLNHLMLHDPDGDPTGYSMLSSTEVDDEFVGALVDWLADRLR